MKITKQQRTPKYRTYSMKDLYNNMVLFLKQTLL